MKSTAKGSAYQADPRMLEIFQAQLDVWANAYTRDARAFNAAAKRRDAALRTLEAEQRALLAVVCRSMARHACGECAA